MICFPFSNRFTLICEKCTRVFEMSITIGHMAPYSSAEETIEDYLSRFDSFMEVNAVDEKKKMSLLIVYGGNELFESLKTVCRPFQPRECAYKEKVVLLRKLLSSSMDKSVARKRFFDRVQEPHEGISDFAMAIRDLAGQCDFGDYVDQAMRDRFIYNLRNETVRVAVMKAHKDKFEDAVSEASLQESSSEVSNTRSNG